MENKVEKELVNLAKRILAESNVSEEKLVVRLLPEKYLAQDTPPLFNFKNVIVVQLLTTRGAVLREAEKSYYEGKNPAMVQYKLELDTEKLKGIANFKSTTVPNNDIKLVFYGSGNIEFFTPSRIYKSHLSRNSRIVIEYLVRNAPAKFDGASLVALEGFKPAMTDSDPERVIRDIFNYVRMTKLKLGVHRKYDPFLVENGMFSINCPVQIL